MRELDVYHGPVRAPKPSFHARAQVRRQWRGTRDFREVPVTVQSQQAMKVRQQNQVTTPFAFDDARDHPPDTALIERSIEQTKAKQLLGLTLGLLTLFHFARILRKLSRHFLRCLLGQP